MNRFSEKDWKLFRSKIADWQEAYMEKLNQEYIGLLSGEGNASDKFWALEKRIREDKKDCGVQCEMSRSNQFYIMMSLLNEGAITLEDLDEFSDDLKDTIKHFFKRKWEMEGAGHPVMSAKHRPKWSGKGLYDFANELSGKI